MLILIFFAFLAGIVTVLSPCVLPVLPILLSAGASRLRPLGIIAGLVCSFTFFTLALTSLVYWTGISPDLIRYIAIALIVVFGLVMLFPPLGNLFAKATSRFSNIPIQSGSGFMLGVALGLIWTPCAGPILAFITALVATQAITFSAVVITIAYSLGAAIPMLLIMFGGKKITDHFSPYAEEIRKGFGALMILAAVSIALHWDVKFQEFALQYIPLVEVEDNPLVLSQLGSKDQSDYPVPPLEGITGWINTKPFTFDQLKGKVVLVDFWTYSCINCIRTFPYLKEWDKKYRNKGLVIVGVHTPEFEFEKKLENVQDAVKRFGIPYPVVLDSQHKTWNNFENRYWPAHYLIDQKGIVRSVHFGEGDYMKTENEIRALLSLPPLSGKEPPVSARPLTPETYLGSARSENRADLKGEWEVGKEKITSKGNPSTLNLNFLASNVYLVMESDKPQQVKVLLDGKPFGKIEVHEPRKYDVVNVEYGRHLLTLEVPEGVSLYAFTFGGDDTAPE